MPQITPMAVGRAGDANRPGLPPIDITLCYHQPAFSFGGQRTLLPQITPIAVGRRGDANRSGLPPASFFVWRAKDPLAADNPDGCGSGR